MTEIPAEILRELEVLRDGVRESAAEMVHDLARGWSNALASPTRDGLEEVMAKAHRLAGTAATFGLTELSGPAYALESLLVDLLASERLDESSQSPGTTIIARLQARPLAPERRPALEPPAR